jgi:hypothetical protein
MQSLYARPHRGSIYEPATIHDIPQEVLEKALRYLLPDIESVDYNILSASLACRAWRPVAKKLRHFFNYRSALKVTWNEETWRNLSTDTN